MGKTLRYKLTVITIFPVSYEINVTLNYVMYVNLQNVRFVTFKPV